MTKEVEFRGSALDDLRAFPKAARQSAGYQLERVQNGETPSDWKSVSTIGSGVQEIRINEDGDAFRVIMIAKLPEAIYVLHCFQKKSRKTSKSDLAIARKRYRDLMEEIGK